MPQQDWLMKEIEKIGSLLRAIIDRLIHLHQNEAIKAEDPFETTKELLFNEINFDLDKFLTLDEADCDAYLNQFTGVNSANLELLAEVFFQLGINGDSVSQRKSLEKAMQLYELCNTKDKTYSITREEKIKEIRNILSKNKG